MGSLLFERPAPSATPQTELPPTAKPAAPPAKKRKAAKPAAPPAPLQRGRPTGYSPELAKQICDELASTREGFGQVCKKLGVAVKSAWNWLSKHEDFWHMYARARSFQTELMYDEIMQIASAPLTHNGMERDDPDNPGIPLTGAEAFAETNRRKLIIDVMKFNLVKLQPKRFGNAQELNHNVSVQHKLSPEQFDALLQVHTKAASIGPASDDEEYIDHEEI